MALDVAGILEQGNVARWEIRTGKPIPSHIPLCLLPTHIQVNFNVPYPVHLNLYEYTEFGPNGWSHSLLSFASRQRCSERNLYLAISESLYWEIKVHHEPELNQTWAVQDCMYNQLTWSTVHWYLNCQLFASFTASLNQLPKLFECGQSKFLKLGT
jgi:hypothetical protein